MPKLILLLLLPFCLQAQPFSPAEIKRWKAQAQNVTIQRDNWGIPHIYGNTDADAVFGLLYAQCEDDFKRVEMNYIEKLGRLAEVKGDTALYDDLYLRLIIDSAEAMADYRRSPSWLKQLLQAYADGINYYLYTHPAEKPLLLRRFQAWYPLLWTDGSIGAISTGDITENDVKAFYGGGQPSPPSAALLERQARREMLGSNGFAIAPALSATGNALLYINPHVTFYFRPEVQVASKQGLNVYGAVTWGQFFVYQGFNEYCGWMHTSSNVDVADLYAEQIIRQNGRLLYRYDGKLLPVRQKRIGLRYQTAQGMQTKTFTAYYTHHGPIMGQRNGQWIAVRGYNRSLTSLLQSWLRTKSTGYASYRQTMQLRSNTSNNTVFADREGNIAYWHGNYVPVRDSRYNWSKPVDGSTSATEWKGLHELADIVQLRNPPNGWIQNCNSTPFTAAGSNSPVRERYPSYMAPDGENFRGLNAARVLAQQNRYTLDKLIAAGYDRTLAIFEVLLPSLIRAFDSTVVPGSPQHALLQGPIQELRQWDYRCDNASVATTLAVEWAQRLSPLLQKVYADIGEPDQVANARQLAAHASANELLQPLQQTVETLQRKFGKWQLPWGQLNRYQRIGSDIDQRFNDAQPSQPVPFASSTWGMLPAYNSKYYPGSQLRYGVGGNSFVCAVEFGKKIKAQSLLAGGQSGHADSPHFTDQLLMYTEGRFKDVLFYQEDVDKHTVKKYHPGE